MPDVPPPQPRTPAAHPWGTEPTASKHRRHTLPRALAAADLVGLVVAAGIATAAGSSPRSTVLTLGLAVLLSLAAIAATGLYRQHNVRPGHSTPDELSAIGLAVTFGTWIASLIAMLHSTPPLQDLAVFWLSAVLVVSAYRAVARAICQRRPWYGQNAVIVGAGRVGRLVAEKYRKHPEFGVRVVGFVDSDPLPADARPTDPPLLGRLDELPAVIREFGIERAVVAFSRDRHEDVIAVLSAARSADVHLDIVPRYFDLVGPSATLHQLEGVGIVGLPPSRPSRAGLRGKRLIDVAAAGLGLLALAPVLLLLAVLIRLDSPGPITYRGRRVGQGGKEIELFKFRTMHPDADLRLAQLLADDEARREFDETHKIADDPRVTRFGRVLRRTSIDELPQLFNVLRGELSLVGPRPVTKHEWDDRFGPDCPPAASPVAGYWLVDELRPGLTGYWQISGRSVVTFDERMRLDMAYLSSWSLRFDLYILARTIRTVVSKDGAY